ncbi:MAG: FAD-binding oxidoreductase, partial [Deltaproteobacteria bacterium]|nr:FAD-binding oxidoreductase [Deltaproteobacteria bacterium]
MTLSSSTFRDLRNISGKAYCSNAKEDLVCYGYDATALNFLPDAIVFPEKTSQVATILRLAEKDNF